MTKKTQIIILILVMATVVRSNSIMRQILQSSLHGLNLTENCENELDFARKSYDENELWAIKLVDASGRAQSGFIWGNNYWISAKELCTVIENPVKLALSERYARKNVANLTSAKSPFSLNYQVVYVKHDSVYQLEQKIYEKDVIHVGVCMPKSCSTHDTSSLVQHVLVTFKDDYKLIGNNFTIVSAKIVEPKPESVDNFFFYFLITGLSIYGSIIILATVYSVIVRKMIFKKQKVIEVLEVGHGQVVKKKNHLDTFILFFSLAENYKQFRKRDAANRSQISVIHGIRAIGMLWIIAAHIYFFSFGTVDNMQLAMNYADLFIAQPMLNAAINVDTFFALSGFLLAYTFFENSSTDKRPLITLFKYIIIRYLRITIPYIPIFFVSTTLSIYMRGASNFWFIEQNDYNCATYWWRNFLFINNWYPLSEMCIIPSWYLSVDFQCFLVSIFLLVLSMRLPRVAVTAFVLLFLATTGYSGYVGYTGGFSFLLDVQFNTIETMYIPTWTRMGGYIVGVAAGWLYMQLNKDMKLKRTFVASGWIICYVLGASIVFGQTIRTENRIMGALFMALCRPLWALANMWSIFVCSMGYGGIMTKIFNHKVWIGYSRLSFAAYLVNPLIIFWVSMISDVPFHMELVSTTVFLIGYIRVIYFMAKWFALIFEYPTVRLIKKVLKNIDKRKERKQQMATRL